jgi:hypothetical protein
MDDGTGSVPTGTTSDDDRPTLAVTGTTVLEDAGWAVFRVDLNRASGLDIQFTPSVADGTGTAGTDTGASASIQYYDSTAATSASSSTCAGITLLYSCPSTVIFPANPSHSTRIVRPRSSPSQSLFASGGYAGGAPCPPG